MYAFVALGFFLCLIHDWWMRIWLGKYDQVIDISGTTIQNILYERLACLLLHYAFICCCLAQNKGAIKSIALFFIALSPISVAVVIASDATAILHVLLFAILIISKSYKDTKIPFPIIGMIAVFGTALRPTITALHAFSLLSFSFFESDFDTTTSKVVPILIVLSAIITTVSFHEVPNEFFSLSDYHLYESIAVALLFLLDGSPDLNHTPFWIYFLTRFTEPNDKVRFYGVCMYFGPFLVEWLVISIGKLTPMYDFFETLKQKLEPLIETPTMDSVQYALRESADLFYKYTLKASIAVGLLALIVIGCIVNIKMSYVSVKHSDPLSYLLASSLSDRYVLQHIDSIRSNFRSLGTCDNHDLEPWNTNFLQRVCQHSAQHLAMNDKPVQATHCVHCLIDASKFCDCVNSGSVDDVKALKGEIQQVKTQHKIALHQIENIENAAQVTLSTTKLFRMLNSAYISIREHCLLARLQNLTLDSVSQVARLVLSKSGTNQYADICNSQLSCEGIFNFYEKYGYENEIRNLIRTQLDQKGCEFSDYVGRMLYEYEFYPNAMSVLSRAVYMDNNNLNAAYWLILTEIAQQILTEPTERIQTLMQRAENAGDWHIYVMAKLQSCNQNLPQGNITETLLCVDQVITIAERYDLTTSQMYNFRGTCKTRMDDVDGALADFATAQEKGHKHLNENSYLYDRRAHADAFNNMGLLYWTQGNVSEAADQYHKALRIFKLHTQARKNLELVETLP